MPAVRKRIRTTTSDTAMPKRASSRRGRVAVNLFKRDAYPENDPQLVELKRYTSQQIDDPFSGTYATQSHYVVLKPAYSPYALIRLPNENSILRQCIDAYVVNIEGSGHRLEYIGPEGAEDSVEAVTEYNRLTSLLDQPNAEYSLVELRSRLRRDRETLGYAFMEVGRDNTGVPSLMYHMPAHTVRLTSKDSENVQVNRVFYRNGKQERKTVTMRFRRFVQQVGNKTIYFKEFGDPRPIDPATGKVNAELSIEDQATELYHFTQYAPGDAYGLPRWINQLPSILGTRESELTNLQFFKDNAIPAMAVLVSGGMLTDDAVENIENHLTGVRGREAMNRVLVIEATGIEENASETGQVPAPRLDLKPLSDARQKDGMFQEYEEKSMVKIRSSFRLPPLFLGRTEDMTYATASASLQVAETQVFGPERSAMDDMFNLHILSDDGAQPTYWRMRSLPPRITDPKEITEAMSTLNDLGAMTPNVAIGLTNELFDLNIPMIEAAWGNYPISFDELLMDKDVLAGVEELYAAIPHRKAPTAPSGTPDPKAVQDGEDPNADPAKKSGLPTDEEDAEYLKTLNPGARKVQLSRGVRIRTREKPVIKMRRLV